MRQFIILSLFAINSMTSRATVQDEKLVLSDGKACHAKVFSNDAIVLPAHCLQNPKEILFEDLGVRKIAKIKGWPSSGESLLTVKFTDVLFPNSRSLDFAKPVLGRAAVMRGNALSECRITDLDAKSRTFDHDCASRDGESGKLIMQNGKPVGIHLGTLGAKTSIAAMSDGPRFENNPDRFLAYHPQGLKISCCKKLVKAFENFGNAIANGADALSDLTTQTIEALKGELSRIDEDLRVLPKALSTDYVQKKVSEIKLPKLPEIKIDDAILKQGQFKWDLPDLKLPTISLEPSRNSVMGKMLSGLSPVIETVSKGLVDFNMAVAKAAFDTGRAFDYGIRYILEQLTGDGGINQKPICNSNAGIDANKQCIVDFEEKIKVKELLLSTRRSYFAEWLLKNKSLPDPR